jgi:N-acyl homoserine lactone hydrolase
VRATTAFKLLIDLPGVVVTEVGFGPALLFDIGMGGDPWVDQHYRPRRTGLEQALSSVDASVDDVDLVANCHLHFDHCGGNASFAGKPILTQVSELAAARTMVDYTLAELIDTPGTGYEELVGEAEVLP